MDNILKLLAFIDNFYWGYIGWTLIIAVGLYFTIISRALQFRLLFSIKSNIKNIYSHSNNEAGGIHPFKLYFASVGGMVGLGNIVFISMALMIGGPGSIFWTFIASICGMLLKYSEIFLGVKYRIQNPDGTFSGGPMYFLQKAFGTKFFAYVFAFLLCLYGVEISNFLIIVDRIDGNFEFINRYVIIALLLCCVLYSAIGGIGRLANICTIFMPFFMIGYVILSLYIIYCNASLLPSFFQTVIVSAFTGHAPIGGFLGSTMILSAYLGTSKAVYSGDICIGYDAIVQSETKIANPHMQATLAIYGLFTDTLICILTNTMLGVTGAWYTLNNVAPSDIVSTALSEYVAYSDLFITILLFFAGFTTIIAYLTAGIKCAEFIHSKYGKIIYLSYAIFAFIFFCHFEQKNAIIIMSILSGFLALLNICGIFLLRKDIKFNMK